ncbi:hypothetical protein, partial [Escherichia coli]
YTVYKTSIYIYSIFCVNKGRDKMKEEKVLLHRFLFVVRNKNGCELSCSADLMGTRDDVYKYFSDSVSGLDVELIDVSCESEWEEHSH